MVKNAVGVALLVLAVVVAPAHAAPPSEQTGTIELVRPVSASGGDGSAAYPSYGDRAEFAVGLDGRFSKNSRTYVTVLCWIEGTVEYQYSADPSFAFPLEDQPGQGLDWPEGAAAECEARLIHREEKGRNVALTTLDVAAFSVAATA